MLNEYILLRYYCFYPSFLIKFQSIIKLIQNMLYIICTAVRVMNVFIEYTAIFMEIQFIASPWLFLNIEF